VISVIPVLYVDDDRTLLGIGKLFLERSGDFEVTVAESADDGINLLRDSYFEAVVSDYQMPDMDGIQFLRYLRGQRNDIPFILFTGKGRESVVIEALNNGADFYLQKGGDPIAQFFELGSKIQQAVRRKRAEDTLKKRIDILTRPPADLTSLSFDDLFDRNKIQVLQDAFSYATGISSVIMTPDGVMITTRSNPSDLFVKIIEVKEKGQEEVKNAMKSLLEEKKTKSSIKLWMDGCFFNARVAINVGDYCIADWFIEHVMNCEFSMDKMKNFLRKIGADEEETASFLPKIVQYSENDFSRLVYLLECIIEQLTTLGFRNIQQAWEITRIRENKIHENEFQFNK